tara:strand:- start:197 stop:1456 length:1260 start_codon:yes stop_codon:yes gene_type:complete
MKKLHVVELFAGVGGFRLGLEGYKGKSSTSGYQKSLKKNFEVVWSNQHEPSRGIQHANNVYMEKFNHLLKKENISHDDRNINLINSDDLPKNFDVLVGGFPCQDYSVANSLRTAKGIEGIKGVLWWEIVRLIKELKKKPQYLILENVDRLLKSPVDQRGRDFAIMLSVLNDLGYAVEWRIINAADFGFPQKRKRVFIIAYLGTTFHDIFNYQFKYKDIKKNDAFHIKGTLPEITNNFGKESKISRFLDSGFCINRKVTTKALTYEKAKKSIYLGDIIETDINIIEHEFWIDEKDLKKWKVAKGAKKINREDKISGFQYRFSEGKMSFPDKLNKPSRTIITSEGGKSPSRFKHIIKYQDKYRRLTPLELERLNMFPDNHTKVGAIKNSTRAFLMGNALVVGVIEKIGLCIVNLESKMKKK